MCPMIRIKSNWVLHIYNEIQRVLVLADHTACLCSQDLAVPNASRVWGLLHVHGHTAFLTNLTVCTIPAFSLL